MFSTKESSPKASTSRLFKIVRLLLSSLWNLVKLLVCIWAALAIYYSNLPWAWPRLIFAITFFMCGLWALWVSRKPRMRCIFVGLVLGVLTWFLSIPPSHDRDWLTDVAIMPRSTIEGDRILISGYQDFSYRQWNDFDANYHEREVFLSHLTSVDFYISYWKEGPIAHTFLSFNFDNAPPVCISIEVRPEVGEGFAPIASMFKQFELIYVVGDERDLVRSRTNFRHEDLYLYRIQAQPEVVQKLFMIYMKRINELSDNPEWYHLLKNNCTLNIIRYKKNAVGSASWTFDYRHLFNGWVDSYLYQAGYLDSSMPFEELRKKSLINQFAKDTDNDISARDFSSRIRESLPGMGVKVDHEQSDPD